MMSGERLGPWASCLTFLVINTIFKILSPNEFHITEIETNKMPMHFFSLPFHIHMYYEPPKL